MAKQKPQIIEPKVFTPDELSLGLKKLDRRLTDLRGIDPKATRYNDPKVERIQSDIRETILDVFGPKSSEFKEHEYFSISQGPFTIYESDEETQGYFQEGYTRAVELISGLIKRLKEKQEDLSQNNRTQIPRIETKRTNKVFIVHGRDEDLKSSMARFVERLGLEPVILSEQPNKGKTIIEKFETNANVSSAIVLLSPDDLGCLAVEYNNESTKLKSRARQNTLLELGYFVGKLGREYVLAICKGNLEIPSDWHGVIYIPFDLAGGWKLEVVKELENMGMPIDKSKIV